MMTAQRTPAFQDERSEEPVEEEVPSASSNREDQVSPRFRSTSRALKISDHRREEFKDIAINLEDDAEADPHVAASKDDKLDNRWLAFLVKDGKLVYLFGGIFCILLIVVVTILLTNTGSGNDIQRTRPTPTSVDNNSDGNLDISGSDSDPSLQQKQVKVDPVPDYLTSSCEILVLGDGDPVYDHLCRKTCKDASCCWNQTNPDYEFCRKDETTKETCIGYADVCDAAMATPASHQSLTTTTTATSAPATQQQQDSTQDQDYPYSKEMIDDVCLNHDNSVGVVNLCVQVCQGSDCCFDGSRREAKTCADNGQPDFPCEQYAACSVLHNTQQGQVQNACSTGTSAEGGSGADLSDCVKICADATCCFTSDLEKICSKTNPDVVCSQYQACEILFGAEIRKDSSNNGNN